MKNVRLLVFDVGNTLIDSAFGRISDTVVTDLYKLREHGYILGITTLRSKDMLCNIFSQFSFDFGIFANGGLIELRNELIYAKPLNAALKSNIRHQSQASNIDITEYNYDNRTFAVTLHAAVEKFIPPMNCEYCIWDHSGNIDITAKGVSKAYALNIVCNALNVTLEQVVAFGDGFNDIDIFKVVGYSVAMCGAPRELLEVADLVTETAKNDGISLAFRKMELL